MQLNGITLEDSFNAGLKIPGMTLLVALYLYRVVQTLHASEIFSN